MNKHPLEEVKWGSIGLTNYKGCLVSKLIGGYSIFGKKCLTPADVDKVIENAAQSIKQSLTNTNA